MLKDKTLNRILNIAFLVYIFIAGILGFMSFINVFWLYGWLIGGISSIFSYLLGIIFIKTLFKRVKNKYLGILLGLFKNFIQMIFFSIITISIIVINNSYNSIPIFWSGVNKLFSPINFISYLFGIGIIPISILISIIRFKKDKNE